jgi:hypothetical protein
MDGAHSDDVGDADDLVGPGLGVLFGDVDAKSATAPNLTNWAWGPKKARTPQQSPGSGVATVQQNRPISASANCCRLFASTMARRLFAFTAASYMASARAFRTTASRQPPLMVADAGALVRPTPAAMTAPSSAVRTSRLIVWVRVFTAVLLRVGCGVRANSGRCRRRRNERGFKETALQLLIDHLPLLLQLDENPLLRKEFNQQVLERFGVFRSLLIKVSNRFPELKIRVRYVTKSVEAPNEKVQLKAERLRERIKESFQISVPEVDFVGAADLMRAPGSA